MADYNWDDFGKEIQNKVDHAVQNGDFSDLSRSIGDIINSTIDTVKDSVKGNVPHSADRGRRWENPYRTNRGTEGAGFVTAPELYAKRPRGKAAGILMALGGYAGVIVFGILALVFLVPAVAFHFPAVVCLIFAVLAAAALVLGICGTVKLKFASRYQRYIRLLRQQVYMPIAELARRTGKSLEYTTRDLHRMMEKQLFFQAHIDEEDHYLIMSDEAYREYSEAKTDYILRRKEADRARREEQEMPPECRKLMEDGQVYIDHIRKCNDRIPDGRMTEKLSQMERVVTRIFEVVRVHPEVSSDLNRMMNYYLPTTKKLLDAYMELDGQPVEGDHISSTKTEIEETIDTLNAAFEKLLDSLFQDKSWDISSDISVLNTMLAQDGLKDDGFGR